VQEEQEAGRKGVLWLQGWCREGVDGSGEGEGFYFQKHNINGVQEVFLVPLFHIFSYIESISF